MRKYEKYKDSGIEWLGMVPEHWKIKRVKDITTKVGSGVTPKGGADVYLDQGIMFFRSQNIHNNKIDYTDIAYISTEINKKMSNTRIYRQDILLNITGASIGRCFYVPFGVKGNVNQHVCIIRPKQKIINTKFLHYSIISDYGQGLISICQTGANREGLNFQQINNFDFLTPDISEQNSIVGYLDPQTQLIDKKIELLNKKIDTYKELRKSLINKVVCRGLDKSVKLKDSGIDWIGKIPEHWEVKRVKDVFEVGRGRVIAQTELVENGKYPVYSSQTENNGCLGYIDTYDYNKELLTWTTDGVNAGTVFKRQGEFNCTNVCGTLKPQYGNLSYLSFSLQESTKHNKRIDTNGAKIMNNEMSIIHFVYPPIEEQDVLVEYIENKTSKIDSIIINIQQQIEKLQELRKTLINDVVTGKIKVTE